MIHIKLYHPTEKELMATLSLLYKTQYAINESIKISIPKVGEIIDKNEDDYYSLVSLLTAMPIDMIAQLDEAGIDFTTINEYDLFLLMFNAIKNQDTSLIFGELDLSKFKFAETENETNKSLVLLNTEQDVIIDRLIYNQIASVLRKIHHLEKNRRKPANEEAKQYMIERARARMKRTKKRQTDSQLESIIIAMVNSEQYKYNFEETKGLSIYQFNESVQQVIKKNDYNNRMYGVYTGTINIKDLSQDDLNWLIRK